MVPFLLAALTPASANGFNETDTPFTMDLRFEWNTSPTHVMGHTLFTFAPGTNVSTSSCNAIESDQGFSWCQDGTFVTGNHGAGDYSTRIQQFGCIVISSDPGFLGGYFDIQRCQTRQTLTATYQYNQPTSTPAVYTGTATLGRSQRVRLCNIYLGCTGWSNFVFNTAINNDYSGTLSGPSTGTWSEL